MNTKLLGVFLLSAIGVVSFAEGKNQCDSFSWCQKPSAKVVAKETKCVESITNFIGINEGQVFEWIGQDDEGESCNITVSYGHDFSHLTNEIEGSLRFSFKEYIDAFLTFNDALRSQRIRECIAEENRAAFKSHSHNLSGWRETIVNNITIYKNQNGEITRFEGYGGKYYRWGTGGYSYQYACNIKI